MTQPQHLLDAQHSEQFRIPLNPDEALLICVPDEIFHIEDSAFSIRQIVDTGAEVKDIRTAVINDMRLRQKKAQKTLACEFLAQPNAAHKLNKSYNFLTDCLIHTAWMLVTTVLHPLSTSTEGECFSVLAVGGYGRGEMAPHSDVDLLFLTPYKQTPWSESVIESMLYILWDLKLKIGHASRTIKECLRLGKEDFTIRTAMLEHRHICGDVQIAQDLDEKLWSGLFRGTASEFIDAKLREREARHIKQGGQRYMVEPNVKEGKGGLRDLHSLFWIAKYVHQVRSTADLSELGLFSQEEHVVFVSAERFLWAVRSHLHLITGRASDQLTFDLQVEVADRMGYKDQGGRRAVEMFMQDYFGHATNIGDLTRIFLTFLEASHAKAEPLLQKILRRKPVVKSDYNVVHNRLSIKYPDSFLGDPLNLLRLFEEALRTGLLIHPDAMRLVSANLNLFDEKLRQDKEAQRIFLDLMIKHGNPERALRRMNELGALAAFIPEFKPIVAMMQFNMYHSYTVDEHTIQCIRNLAEIEREELVEELPLASSILKCGLNRKVLYVALLVHDIGKGRKEDHSILGAKISRIVSQRLGLSKWDIDTVEWLVRYHLLMSDMAQKRDISDPRTIRDFAKAVQNVRRLNLLTVLTVCDIRGVGPNSWNNWKAALIRELYRQTANALETGLEDLNRETRGTKAKSNLRTTLSHWDTKDLKIETARHYPPYWQGLHVTTHVVFANLLRNLQESEIRIDLHPDINRDATRICFALFDHPGVFSRLSGALALVGANVVDARSYTSTDGFATSVFWVQDSEGHPYDASRLSRLRDIIYKTLKGEVVARDAIKDKDKLKKRERAFKVGTSITFNNEGSEIYTIIEVDTRDRPGLLFDLTRTLANANVYINSAVIATYGAQVVDTFYVKDMFGLKFHSQSKQRTLKKKLLEAIELGAERAIG
ncbi:MAG: [protein-PII] uridylyltransferase [Paracoccaceae bacterium]|nr:[protein-PII] uridylyltransferase [Paracoccaceae bacterium]